MKTSIVMEGGAMRGLFTAGVIDVLMENNITFDVGVGISAGATFGYNIKAKQNGRIIRYIKKYCTDYRYGSLKSLIKHGELYENDFCYRQISHELDPIDFETYENNPMQFYVGAFDEHTGKMFYHECKDMMKTDGLWVRGSSALPILFKPSEVEGHLLFDGGLIDSIPYSFAESIGCQKNLAVLTQPEGFIKKPIPANGLLKLILKNYPNTYKALLQRHLRYNEQVEYVENKEKEGNALIIRPPESLNIGKIEKNPDELERVYQIGRKAAESRIDEIKTFLQG